MELNSELDTAKRNLAELKNKLATLEAISVELERAEKKHPEWPTDMFRQVAIMNEEAGEVTKAVLHYHYEGGSLEHVRDELIQTAAMCVRMLKNLKPSNENELNYLHL